MSTTVETGWTQEAAKKAYECFEAGQGESWFDPQCGMERRGDPRYYVTRDGVPLHPELAPVVGVSPQPKPSASNTGAAGTHYVHQHAPRQSDGPAYEWDHEKYGPYMRVPKLIREAAKRGEITWNDYEAYEAVCYLAPSPYCWGRSTEEYAAEAGLSVDVFRTCQKHLCAAGFWAIEPWRHKKDHGHDTSVYVLYPFNLQYDIADIVAIRERGEPDPTRPRNVGVHFPGGQAL